MKKLYALILGILAVGMVNAQRPGNATRMEMPNRNFTQHASAHKAQAVDTLFQYINRASSAVLYGVQMGGYIFGPGYDTIQGTTVKVTDESAVHFDPYGVPVKVVEVLAWVGHKAVVGSADTIYARVYDANADTTPGVQKGFGMITTSQLTASTNLVFSTIPITTYNGTGQVSGAFLVSYDYAMVNTDTFGIVCSNPDSADGAGEFRTRQKLSVDLGGAWLPSDVLWGGFNADVFLFPVVDDSPVSTGQPINFKGLTVLGTYPNPATTESHIRFSLDKAQTVKVKVFDLSARALLEVEKEFAAGENEVTVDLSNVASGSYYYTLTTQGQSLTAKLNVTK